MSVPRPAMFVAMVTAPLRPACAMICASFSWNLAFRTACLMPRLWSRALSSSDFSIEMVPTRTGCPVLWCAMMSSITALNLAFSVL